MQGRSRSVQPSYRKPARPARSEAEPSEVDPDGAFNNETYSIGIVEVRP
jgi:hypothetical protein